MCFRAARRSGRVHHLGAGAIGGDGRDRVLLQAIFEKEIRRVLAFSSVAQVGFILLGLSLATYAGASAGLFYLAAHALMKMTLFMALGGLAISLARGGSTNWRA